jgi:hypothetical protein
LQGAEDVAQTAAAMQDALSKENADTSVPYYFAESAMHNAYHLGKIAFVQRARWGSP